MAVRAIQYSIKVEVHEVRALSFKESAGDKEIVPNPYVDVTVCGTTKSTIQKNQVVSATFNSSFNFQATLTPEEFQRSHVEVSVMHRYTLVGGLGLQSALIGKYVLSFAFVYAKSQHWIYRQWVKLSNFDQLMTDPVSGAADFAAAAADAAAVCICTRGSLTAAIDGFCHLFICTRNIPA